MNRISTTTGLDQSAFATEEEFSLVRASKKAVSSDPAERMNLGRPSEAKTLPFDGRSDSDLKHVARFHEDKIERERALWEYAQRIGSESSKFVVSCLNSEKETDVRIGLLWLLQKIAGDRSVDFLSRFISDREPEIRDWALLLIREVTGQSSYEGQGARRASFCEENSFDQTLPLLIAGFARTYVPSLGWVQATLSPLWFESIMGRVMACTCMDNFNSTLVIEKKLKGYHPNGSDHFETYHFKGATFSLSDRLAHHVYQGQGKHTFYPKGKVEDPGETDPIGNVTVGIARTAITMKVPAPLLVDGGERARRIATSAVESVRGVYTGPAYVNVERLMSNGMAIGAGEVQLTDPHHPVVGRLTNTLLWGTFKGKLSDLNGDGIADLNSERCHSTADGVLDYRLLGHANPDPYDPIGLVE